MTTLQTFPGEVDPDADGKAGGFSLRERDLPRHLRGDNELLEPVADPGAIPIQPIARPGELDDSGVREALNLLMGLSAFRHKDARDKGARGEG